MEVFETEVNGEVVKVVRVSEVDSVRDKARNDAIAETTSKFETEFLPPKLEEAKTAWATEFESEKVSTLEAELTKKDETISSLTSSVETKAAKLAAQFEKEIARIPEDLRDLVEGDDDEEKLDYITNNKAFNKALELELSKAGKKDLSQGKELDVKKAKGGKKDISEYTAEVLSNMTAAEIKSEVPKEYYGSLVAKFGANILNGRKA